MLQLSKRQAGEVLCAFKQSKSPSDIRQQWRESGREHTKETRHLNATAISKTRRPFWAEIQLPDQQPHTGDAG
jgi:RecA-family ATPase